MKQFVIAGGVVLVLAGGWMITRQNDSPTMPISNEVPSKALDMADEMNASDQMPAEQVSESTMSDTVTESDATASDNQGTYQVFSPTTLAASTATHNVLIFSATWCPSCRALDKNITENISAVPGDVALFTVDYDTNTALRQQYNVTTQHTLVLVETDGTAIKSWRGGNTLSALLANL
jgi:thioredoxin-like negative regulator of GroEL